MKSTETLITEYLTTRKGEPVQIRTIAHNVGVSEAQVKVTLADMAARGRIRHSYTNGKAAYMMPTDEQREREERARSYMPAWSPEHRISKERSELYARIDAERVAYPSLG